MKRMKRQCVAGVLAVLMLISAVINPVLAKTKAVSLSDEVAKIIKGTAEYSKKMSPSPVAGSIGGDWTVFGVAASEVPLPGLKDWFKKYTLNLYPNLSTLRTPSDYARTIMALGAIGADVRKIRNTNLLGKMTENQEDVFGTPSDAIYTLLAVDSGNYDISVELYGLDRNRLIEGILSFQCKDKEDAFNDGGFGSFYGGTSFYADVDTTAMAIQALAPYYVAADHVLYVPIKKAVDRALVYLRRMQNANGGFGGNGMLESSCSTAQVLLALCCLKIDPLDGANGFVMGENNLYTSLMKSYNKETGAFKEIVYDGISWEPVELADNPMATDQCLYALVGYQRFLRNKASVFDIRSLAKLLPPDAASLTLNKKSFTITGVNKTSTIAVRSVEPENAFKMVTWSSSNSNIVRINKTNGKITTVAAGKAKITATAVTADSAKKITSTITVTVKLPAPASLKAIAGRKRISIVFNKVVGAKQYEIYRRNGKTWKRIGRLSRNVFSDQKVVPGKRYQYKVLAVNGQNRSGFSRTVTTQRVR